jgi:formamidopyrimidine-DNA glycosylase
MPEAAEVETIRRQLEAHLPLRVLDVRVQGARTVRAHPAADLQVLNGSTIATATRQGKWLGLAGPTAAMRVHLRMSGRLLLRAPGLHDAHEHAVLRVLDAAGEEQELVFVDPRTFGEVALWYPPSLGTTAVDVLDDGHDDEVLKQVLQSKRCLKTLLLDQHAVIQGLGNIYVDEVCHRLGVQPAIRSDRLGVEAAAKLMPAIRAVIEEAVANRGTALRDEGWSDLYGVLGGHGPHLMVHEQALCRTCHGAVTRAKVSNRTTYSCDACQEMLR